MKAQELILTAAASGLAFTPAGLHRLYPGECSEREIADASSLLMAQGKLDGLHDGFVGLKKVIDSVNKDVENALLGMGNNKWRDFDHRNNQHD